MQLEGTYNDHLVQLPLVQLPVHAFTNFCNALYTITAYRVQKKMGIQYIINI